MSLCNTALNGIQLSCDTNTGGIERFWIAVKHDVNGLIKIDESKKVTDVEAPDGENWKTYEVRSETSTVAFAGVEGAGGSIKFWNYTLTIVVDKIDSAKNREIEQLQREPIAVIFEDNNGKRWLIGDVRGAKLMAATAGDYGTAYTDNNQYTLSIECPMPHLAYELAEDCEIYPKSESLG